MPVAVQTAGQLSLLVFFLALSPMAAHGAPDGETGGDPFPTFQQVPPEVRMPRDAKVTVAPAGHYLVNGKPRYLIGVHPYQAMRRGLAPTEGYPDSLKWLYEQPLTYHTSQRVGFDTTGTSIPNDWAKHYVPDRTDSNWNQAGIQTFAQYIRNIGLPIMVDMNAAPWSQGVLYHEPELREERPELFNTGGIRGGNNHWVPYSATHPEARKLWQRMWKRGIEFVRSSGGNVIVYELFNEPGYNDKSAYNRKLFVQRMREKFGTIERLNRAWASQYENFAQLEHFGNETDHVGLCVEWGIFMEDVFADLCALGVQTIREHDTDPEVGVCVQPMHWREITRSNMNPWKFSKIMNAVSTTTGGGGFLEAHFFRSIADGKPIRDGETYLSPSAQGIANKLWLHMARGINASYTFKWEKSAFRWADGGAEAARKLGKQFHWDLLNPFRFPNEALTGFQQARREMHKVGDFFFPRDRGVVSETAVMVSYPTQRLARAAGGVAHNDVHDYAEAVEYGHVPMDVLLEEQLPEGRAKRYKAIIAAGVNATYDETLAHLDDYIRGGGVLILGGESLQHDTYGRERPIPSFLAGLKIGQNRSSQIQTLQFDDLPGDYAVEKPLARAKYEIEVGGNWQPIAHAGGEPVIVRREHGNGSVYFINASMPDQTLAAVLGSLLRQHGVALECKVRSYVDGTLPPSIEIHKGHSDGMTAWFLINGSLEPQLVRFGAEELQQNGTALIDPIAMQELELKQGQAVLTIEHRFRTVLVAGPRADLIKRFGEMPMVAMNDSVAQGRKAIQAYEERLRVEAAKRFSYQVDAARMKPLDLRDAANTGFTDQVAGDGKGGWTDQGGNHLRDLEWGRHRFLGVPFDIIRWDHNEYRSCIVLRSPKHLPHAPARAEDIQVNEQVDSLFFLHASAWLKSGDAFQYVLHRADGSKTMIPIRVGKEVADWYRPSIKQAESAHVGWTNDEGRGLWVHRWENPSPDNPVTSIDVVSAEGGAIPIVVAITAELASGSEQGENKAVEKLNLLDDGLPKNWKLVGWNGVKPELQSPDEDGADAAVLSLTLSEDAKSWGGSKLKAIKPDHGLTMPENSVSNQGHLVFEVNGSQDKWGKHKGRQQLQVLLVFSDGDQNKNRKYVPLPPYTNGTAVDEQPETWQEVRVPLSRLLPGGDLDKLQELSLQYRGQLPDSGIQVKNIRLEWPAETP